MKASKIQLKTICATTVAMVVTWLAPSMVTAAPPATDYFSRTTKPNSQAKPLRKKAATQKSTFTNAVPPANPTQWFEQIDDIVASLRPTEAEKVIMNRPFNQEVERVEQFSAVVTKVARNYREIAKRIHAIPVPGNMPDLRQYGSLTADWYSDAAEIYEDMVKRRPPAKTMDELEAQIDNLKQRAQALAHTSTELKQMDQSLRKTYQVHMARSEDAIHQYVNNE